MRRFLPLLLCGLIAAGPAARPLSDFGLTEPDVERYGFRDSPDGLKDTVRNAFYVGDDREKVLAQLQRWEDDKRYAEKARQMEAEDDAKQRQQEVAAAAVPADQAAQGADAQAQVYDGGQRSILDPGDAVIAAWKARQEGHLPPSSGATTQSMPVPLPPGPTAAPLGLQGRGTVDKIIALVAQSLPGPDLADVARRLTEKSMGSPASAASLPRLCGAAAQRCLNELLSQYYGERKAAVAEDDRPGGWIVAKSDDAVFVKYGAGKKAPGEYLDPDTRLQETQAQELVALGFRRELGLGEGAVVRVILSPDAGVSKNRGVWLSNPVLRRKDGSFDLIFSERVVARAASRDTDLTGPLKASPEREHLLRDVLAGQDPIALENRLNCLLLGWMQAETLRQIEEATAAGKTAEQARKAVQDGIVADPLKSKLYGIASNAQIVSRWDAFERQRLDPIEGSDKSGSSDIWAMVGQANAGDARAKDALLAVLGQKKAGIARVEAVAA